MRTLTNDPRDLEVLNLGSSATGHGPFVVRQEGYVRGREELGADRFFLRRDGVWVLNLAVCALPPDGQRAFFFESLGDVAALLEDLPTGPRVEPDIPPGLTRAAALAAFHRDDNLLWQRMTRASVHPLPGADSDRS